MNELYYTNQETAQLIVNIVLSLSTQSEALHGGKTALASYSQQKNTLHTPGSIAKAVSTAEQAVGDLPGHPGEYLRGLMQALACMVRIYQGETIPYNERLRALQQLEAKPIPKKNFDSLISSIDERLEKKGYAGKAPKKIRAYLQDTLIAPENVVSTAKDLLKGLRSETLQKVVPLPEDEAINNIQGVTGVFWSGFSAYDGNNKGSLSFNIQRPWSMPTFSNILSHEAYPGHQTFYCLWDVLYLRGEWPLEAAYYMVNTPTNALFEGGPENGLDFLGWLKTDPSLSEIETQKRMEYLLGRNILDLQRMAQTQACFDYHMDNATRDEARHSLIETGLFSDIEAENTVRFFLDPIQCTYYPSYYYGKHLVRQALKLYNDDDKPAFFKTLYTVPHTTDTFIKAVAKETKTNFRPFDDI